MPKVVINNFGNKSFMQWKRKLSLHSQGVWFILGGGEEGGRRTFFPPVPNVFSWCVQIVPQVLKLFPMTFPIAPHVYPICFAQSSTLMNINWKDGLKSTFVSICSWGSKEVLLLGSTQCSKNIDGEPINMAPSNQKKSCECTHQLINMNMNYFT
jgi:hypothetical protein